MKYQKWQRDIFLPSKSLLLFIALSLIVLLFTLMLTKPFSEFLSLNPVGWRFLFLFGACILLEIPFFDSMQSSFNLIILKYFLTASSGLKYVSIY